MYSCSLPQYLNKAKYWRSIDSVTAIPFIYSTCSGIANVPLNTTYQWPKKGSNYSGCTIYCPPPSCNINYNRGYFRNRLKQTLQSGKIYCVKFYVNIYNVATYGIDGFGAYFGDNSLDTITKCGIPLPYLIPQVQNLNNNIITDTLGWTLITGTFVATGNEKHMVLGNFKSDVATNTVLINPTYLPTVFADVAFDEVSCIPLDLPAYAAAGSDIWAIPGNTIYLGRPQDVGIDEACEWFKLPNTTNVIANAAGLTLTVAITTNTYMVKQTICGIIKYDTVVVHASGLGLAGLSGVENSVKIYPNPANEILTIEFVTLSGVEASNTKYSIINSLGQIIREEEIDLKNNTAEINTRELANGVYVFALRYISTPLNAGAQGDISVKVNKRFVISR